MPEGKFNFLLGRKPNILGNEYLFKSAVLVPIVNYSNQTCVLFEVRAQELNRQPGEICFPGGKLESVDNNPAEAALRETCEELNLAEDNIKIIAPLDLLVAPFSTVIYPYLCEIKEYEKIVPNPSEVEKVFCVPFDYLYSYQPQIHNLKVKLSFSDNFPYNLIPNGKNYDLREGNYPEYFYIYQHYVIWGMTARILHHFLTLTKGKVS
jgi:8-oxo-dGTP pyrophosphatase MutT (NUDIX family)